MLIYEVALGIILAIFPVVTFEAIFSIEILGAREITTDSFGITPPTFSRVSIIAGGWSAMNTTSCLAAVSGSPLLPRLIHSGVGLQQILLVELHILEFAKGVVEGLIHEVR
jgi:hypothetical protein